MSVSEPAAPRRRTILYLNEGGRLTPTHPSQHDLPFKTITNTGVVRSIND